MNIGRLQKIKDEFQNKPDVISQWVDELVDDYIALQELNEKECDCICKEIHREMKKKDSNFKYCTNCGCRIGG